MKKSFDSAEKYRVQISGYAQTLKGDRFGMFIIPNKSLNVRMVVDDGKETGWEHVSVSMKVKISKPEGDQIKDMIPGWMIMKMAKELFWDDEECVIQFHPPKSVYINRTDNVLHLWKKVGSNYETPPTDLV